MCGICGVRVRQTTTLEQEGFGKEKLERMRKAIAHRGPDAHNAWENQNIYLGHNRLSIIDLSEAGKQPMHAADHLTIVFNGEIYNYIELRDSLQQKGHVFTTETDTEVLLAAYTEWGSECVQYLNGMFAFCIYDTKTEELFLARDHLGIKPLYYYAGEKYFTFASEIKSLLVAGVPRAANNSIIYDYLMLGHYDHTEETFFADIRQLPAGHIMRVDKNLHQSTEQYWDIPVEKTLPDTKKLAELVADSVRMQLRSDVPVGLHLSGGLDSNTLAIYVRDTLKKTTGQLKTFTMCFNDERFDEREHVLETVHLLNSKHTFTTVTPQEILTTLETALYHQDQPFGGISTAAYLHNARIVKEHGVTVVLEGQGGDELFGGYAKYYTAYMRDLYEQQDPHFAEELNTYLRTTGKNREAVITALKMPVQTGLHTDESAATRSDCVASKFKDQYAKQQKKLKRPFSTHLQNAQYQDIKYFKIPRVLRFNDHMTMAHGVELRVPYLDKRIVEFAFSLSPTMLFKEGIGKHIERELTTGKLPDSVRMRQKVSVVTPQSSWLQNEWRGFIEEIITSESFIKRPYFDSEAVQKHYADFCKESNPANSFFVWQWIMVELWLRKYIDPEQFIP